MAESNKAIDSILTALQERTKELNCLYTVEELLGRHDRPVEETFAGVIAAIPSGWQYPEFCRVRIRVPGEGLECVSEGFVEVPWVQTASIRVDGEPVGALDIIYSDELPPADEGPFLKEERKLITSIADRLGHHLRHRQLMKVVQEWRSAQRELARPTSRDWTVIVDLLRRTDQSLLMRVTRKLINHLCWSGVKEADLLLQHSDVGTLVDRQDSLFDSNRPAAKENLPTFDTLVEEAFRIAARHLSDEEIVACIQKWIKQDRASLLVNTLERHHTSLAEVADAIRRYQHSTHGEVELASSTLKGLRVSLIRRYLSDQLEYINVAKHFVDIKDFHELLQRTIFPSQGHGKIGGKSSGLFLAHQIIRHHVEEDPQLADLKIPRTWYITSDGLQNFVYCNHLEDVFSQKYKEIDHVRQEYPDIIQVFKHSHFSSDIIKGLSLALDDFGERPLIVRSSSLLEDRFGAAFSGKYKSLFLANQGTKQERLGALTDAIAEVYASTFGPDPIEYRAERNLLDFQEGMGILIQEVVGTRVGKYFMPAFAGVAFSHNEFRWSPRIRREDGLLRLVPGLGTRAVDRLSDDYPILVSPGQPGLRANATAEETTRYSPKYMDVINLASNRFETVPVRDLLREAGDELPGVEQLVSVYADGHLRSPLLGQIDFENDDLVVTFEGLMTRTPFVAQIHRLLTLLEDKLSAPADIEFAYDGADVYLLQCRVQNPGRHCVPASIPRDIPGDRLLFNANRYVSNGTVPNLTHIVYVDPEKYGALASREEMLAVGRAVSKLNKVLPKRQFVLMGPGRWGSRGDIRLGVSVTYSDINNTAILIEIARKKGDYTPDLSFGTHFFQDLVEASIRYLPLYPDEESAVFNERLLTSSKNILAELAPEFAHLFDVIHVIDVPQNTDGQVLRILMNADLDEAVGVLVPQAARELDSFDEVEAAVEAPQAQHWRWRLRMAERIAAQLGPEPYGVYGFYVFGSTKNATAGPASDIDVLIHFRGDGAARTALTHWLDGWSKCLAELNYLRTGYLTEGLLDAHLVTDQDIAKGTSYAVKIDAVTDAARPLPLKHHLAERGVRPVETTDRRVHAAE